MRKDNREEKEVIREGREANAIITTPKLAVHEKDENI